jgi:hypothetical protein
MLRRIRQEDVEEDPEDLIRSIYGHNNKLKRILLNPEKTVYFDKYINGYASMGDAELMINKKTVNNKILESRLIKIIDRMIDDGNGSKSWYYKMICKLVRCKMFYIAEYIAIRGQIQFNRNKILNLYNYKNMDAERLAYIVKLPKDVMLLNNKYRDICDGLDLRELTKQTDFIFAENVKKTIDTLSQEICNKYVEKCLKKQCRQTLIVLLENNKVKDKTIKLCDIVGVYMIKKLDKHKIRIGRRYWRRYRPRITARGLTGDIKKNELDICNLIDTLVRHNKTIIIKHLKQIAFELIIKQYFQTLFTILKLWRGAPPKIRHVWKYIIKDDNVEIIKKLIDFNVLTVENMHKNWRIVLTRCINEDKKNIVKYLIEDLKIKPLFKKYYVTKNNYKNITDTYIKYNMPIPDYIYAYSIVKRDKIVSNYCEEQLKMKINKSVINEIKNISVSSYIKIMYKNGKSVLNIIKNMLSSRYGYMFRRASNGILKTVLSLDKNLKITEKISNEIMKLALKFGLVNVADYLGNDDVFVETARKCFSEYLANPPIMGYRDGNTIQMITYNKNTKLFNLMKEFKHIENNKKLFVLAIIMERHYDNDCLIMKDIIDALDITKETFLNMDMTIFKYVYQNHIASLIEYVKLPNEFILNYIYTSYDLSTFITKTKHIIDYKTLITPYIFNVIIMTNQEKEWISTMLQISNIKVCPTMTKCLMISQLKIGYLNKKRCVSNMKILLKENNVVEKDIYEIYSNNIGMFMDIKVKIEDNVPFDNDEPPSYMHDYNEVMNIYNKNNKNKKDDEYDYDKEYEKIINDDIDSHSSSSYDDNLDNLRNWNN